MPHPNRRRPLLHRTDAGVILAFPEQRSLVLQDAGEAEPAAAAEYTIVGYRQTEQPACKGGRCNENGFRFRHRAMRAIARSARGQPFITGHNWGDVRARGGTMIDAWADAPADAEPGELGIFSRVRALAAWCIEGFELGTIDRFSIGACGQGEITCTVHGTPIWTDCYCWPGMEMDGVIAEWEYENARVVEFSAVNVPAVEGTYVLEDLDPNELAEALADLEVLAGRRPPHALHAALHGARAGGAPMGGFTRPRVPITMAAMDPREEMARALGLDPSATWEQIRARQAQITAQAAQADVARAQLEESRTALAAARQRETERQAELDAAHVESELTRLRASRQVGDRVIASLRAAAAGPGPNGRPTWNRAAFDANLRLVEEAAPEIVAGAGAPGRAPLQSDARPAGEPGGELTAEPDAYELNRSNPDLPRLMRICKVTVANVREHGPRRITVVPNLAELAAATDRRGA